MIKNKTPPTTLRPATEIPKKLNKYSPAKAKRMSTDVAVINALMAVLLLSFFESSDVMVRKTGIIPIGFIKVRNDVKYSSMVVKLSIKVLKVIIACEV